MNELSKRVSDLITAALEDDRTVQKDWIAAQVMADHPDIYGDDADFYTTLARQQIDETVRKQIGKFKPSLEPSEQLTLPGFTHLQKAYFLRRRGENMIVPVSKCSDIELLGRAREYEEMATGCRSHAREIREYVAARTDQAA